MNLHPSWKFAAGLAVVAAATVTALIAVAVEVPVALDQVPPAVRDTMLAEADGAALTEIEQETRGDTTVYEAEFRRDGVEIEIRVAADGKLLGREMEHGSVRVPQAGLQSMPAPARNAILAEAHGARISELEMEHHQGVAVYEAAWRVNGQTHEVAVTADGALIESEYSMLLADAPAAVQAAVAQHFGANAPRVIERKMIVVYEAEVRIDGRESEIMVFPTGRIADLDDDDDDHEDGDDDDDEDHDGDDHEDGDADD